jgi:hypothetical protein
VDALTGKREDRAMVISKNQPILVCTAAKSAVLRQEQAIGRPFTRAIAASEEGPDSWYLQQVLIVPKMGCLNLKT